jgi:hypothetical protein
LCGAGILGAGFFGAGGERPGFARQRCLFAGWHDSGMLVIRLLVMGIFLKESGKRISQGIEAWCGIIGRALICCWTCRANVHGDGAGEAEEEPCCAAGGFAMALADGGCAGERVVYAAFDMVVGIDDVLEERDSLWLRECRAGFCALGGEVALLGNAALGFGMVEPGDELREAQAVAGCEFEVVGIEREEITEELELILGGERDGRRGGHGGESEE